MTQRDTDFHHVFHRLADEGLLETGWEQKVRDVLVEEHNEQPWYVRVMVGFSAWLASWMLIGFVVGAAVVESEQATLIMGVILVVGAVFARCVSDNDFMTQMALAVSLAGEGLIVFSVFEISDSFEATMFSFILLEAVLVAFYPDMIHRFLSSASIFGALAGLLYKWELQSLLHVIVIGGAAVFMALVFYERRFLAMGQGQLVLPVKWGVLFGQLSVLMLSTIYVLPELTRDFEFFPFRWVSTLGLGVLLLFLLDRLERSGHLHLAKNSKIIAYGTCVALIAIVLKAPGLIMALLLLLLGFARSDRILLGVATGFFIVFLTAYFYGIEVTLLAKSSLLVAAGVVLLAARFALKRFVFKSIETENND